MVSGAGVEPGLGEEGETGPEPWLGSGAGEAGSIRGSQVQAVFCVSLDLVRFLRLSGLQLPIFKMGLGSLGHQVPFSHLN